MWPCHEDVFPVERSPLPTLQNPTGWASSIWRKTGQYMKCVSKSALRLWHPVDYSPSEVSTLLAFPRYSWWFRNLAFTSWGNGSFIPLFTRWCRISEASTVCLQIGEAFPLVWDDHPVKVTNRIMIFLGSGISMKCYFLQKNSEWNFRNIPKVCFFGKRVKSPPHMGVS